MTLLSSPSIHPSLLIQLDKFRHLGWFIDCHISACPGSSFIPVHSIVLSTASELFRDIMETEKFKSSRLIQLNLTEEDSPKALQIAIDFLYSGQLNMDGIATNTLQQLTEHTSLLNLNEAIQRQQNEAARIADYSTFPFPSFFNGLNMFNGNPLLNGLNLNPSMPNPLLQLQLQVLQQHFAACNLPQTPQTSNIGAAPSASQEIHRRRRLNSESAVIRQPAEEECGEIIIQSSDKEGWCRNKKYIEKTESGFMCTVCKKVYGRYNSVSYHVTIYHRNPPIHCDVPDCQFTTREARYIHFHKYYRHAVPLPESIHQESRKCPYCKHVSKSPAMLEKHIKRHQKGEDWEAIKSSISPLSNLTSTPSTSESENLEGRLRTVSELPQNIQIDVLMEEEIETKSRAFTL